MKITPFLSKSELKNRCFLSTRWDAFGFLLQLSCSSCHLPSSCWDLELSRSMISWNMYWFDRARPGGPQGKDGKWADDEMAFLTVFMRTLLPVTYDYAKWKLAAIFVLGKWLLQSLQSTFFSLYPSPVPDPEDNWKIELRSGIHLESKIFSDVRAMLSWLWCWCEGSHSPFRLVQSQSAHRAKRPAWQGPFPTPQSSLTVLITVRWGFSSLAFLRLQGFRVSRQTWTSWQFELMCTHQKFNFLPTHKDLVFIVSFKDGLGHQTQPMAMSVVDDSAFSGGQKCSKCSSQVVAVSNCFLGISKGIEKCLASKFCWVYPWKSWHHTCLLCRAFPVSVDCL